MKKFLIILITLSAVLASCNDYETYGDKKDKERNAISKFIADSSIIVISESQFDQQGHTTNLARNEFVKLSKSGVYMQIVREGCGTIVEDGENANLVCRFEEFDIMNDTLSLCNNTNTLYYYCKGLNGCKVGEAKLSPGFLLPAKYVVCSHITVFVFLCD